jgi:hypothetical protein
MGVQTKKSDLTLGNLTRVEIMGIEMEPTITINALDVEDIFSPRGHVEKEVRA